MMGKFCANFSRHAAIMKVDERYKLRVGEGGNIYLSKIRNPVRVIWKGEE